MAVNELVVACILPCTRFDYTPTGCVPTTMLLPATRTHTPSPSLSLPSLPPSDALSTGHGHAYTYEWSGFGCSERTCPEGDDYFTDGQLNEKQSVTCVATR